MTEPVETRHIEISFLDGILFYAFDLAYLHSTPSSAGFIVQRIADRWLSEMAQRFREYESHGFKKPHYAESAYAKTDRGFRSTFAKRHAHRLLPVRLAVADPEIHTEECFTFFPDCLSISPQGAVSIRIVFRLRDGLSLPLGAVISSYNKMLSEIPDVVLEIISSFCFLWSRSCSDDTLKPITRETLEEIVYLYEVIDFDFRLRIGESISEVESIKELFKSSDNIAARELSAISRMSPVSAAALKDVRISDFVETDLGARDDELWIVNRDRMVRRHPERNLYYNQAFFADVKTAAEVLLCQQATFDFLEAWISKRRGILLDNLLKQYARPTLSQTEFQREFEDLTRVAHLLVEPVVLQRNVRHSFYVKVISRLIECLGLKEDSERASRALRDFTGLIESVTGFNVGYISADMGRAQVELDKSMRRLSQIMVWMTVLVIALMVVQIYVAIGWTSPPSQPDNKNAPAPTKTQ